MVFYTLGQMLIIEAILLLLPAGVSLYYGEGTYIHFLISAAIGAGVGGFLLLILRKRSNVIYAKEGFAIVALTWLAMSAIGALPFYMSGDIPSYTDAFFETVSGFTTTGASILNDVTALGRGMLFWRSFTHWVGGMGVLVFVMAVLPKVSERSIHIIRAEVPGPVVGKLVPKAKDTAKILYLMYLVLTVFEVIFLVCGGMPVFDSIVHTFGTAGTGGFGIRPDSIGSYSDYCQWVIAVFMFLFGLNFNLYYFLLIRKFKTVFKNCEMWVYLGITIVSIAIISANVYEIYGNVEDSVRNSAFQVTSLMSTTGYSTADFDLWPDLSKAILLILMFMGSCAGSTAGGLKISRIILLFKLCKNELRHMLNPRSVNTVKFDGKQVDSATLKTTSNYFVIYVMCFAFIFLLLSFDPFAANSGHSAIETNFSAATACFNNIGPGLGAVGPTLSFSGYSIFSKYLLSFAMLLGRLEIFPMLLLFSKRLWKK